MNADFHIGQDNDTPSLEATLVDENGAPIDGTSITSVDFAMHLADKSRPRITGAAVIVTNNPLVVRYDWPFGGGQTGVPGLYLIEWTDVSAGRRETFSNNNKSTLWIAPSV